MSVDGGGCEGVRLAVVVSLALWGLGRGHRRDDQAGLQVLLSASAGAREGGWGLRPRSTHSRQRPLRQLSLPCHGRAPAIATYLCLVLGTYPQVNQPVGQIPEGGPCWAKGYEQLELPAY